MRKFLHILLAMTGCIAWDLSVAQEVILPSSPPINRPWPASNTDTVLVGDTMVVEWQKPATPARSYGIRDMIHLVVDPRWQVDATARDIRITLEITAKTNPDHGDYQPSEDKDSLMVVQLEVGSRPLADEPPALSRELDLQDVDGFSFLNAHQFQVVLTDVEVDDGSGYQDIPYLPKSLRLELELVYDRVLLLDDLETGPDDLSSQGIDCGGSSTGTPEELAISWAPVDGADGYDLEWSWVDDYEDDGVGLIDPTFDLDRNSSRITTANTYYRIPLLYDRGWIAFRVRAVGHDQYHPQVKVTTAWNGAPSSGTITGPADHFFRIVAGHQTKKNWQVTTTFAEDGKRKEVITYADGTSRARQTVTRNNSLLTPIVGETIYDVVGRPSMEIMPVPHVKARCVDEFLSWGRIDYFSQFNREVDGATHDAITFEDLSEEGSGCGPTAPILHPTNGAEYYYSSDYVNDAAVDANAVIVPPPPFLPKAEGYPYAQTEYTKDNTGRIRTKGGVGELFSMGGHTTTTYYGKPEQLQLDRLFGSEAGYAHHFQKVVTKDPNGQVSISYVDMTGKTVATSLACDTPDPLLPLPSQTTGTVTAATDLFNGLASTSPALEQLTLTNEGPTLVFTTTLAVPCAGDYGLDYSITPVQLTDECWHYQNEPLCVTCGYLLDIYLENSCGEQMQGFPIIGHEVGTLSEGPNGLNWACAGDLDPIDPQPVSIPTITLTEGEYTLTKVLRLDPATREAYIEALLLAENNSCYAENMPDDTDLSGGLDLADCDVTCEECYAALESSIEEFLLAGGTAELYEQLKAECDEVCEGVSWCDVAYKNMLTDVDRLGQYAKYTDELGDVTVTDRASVFHENSVLLNPFVNSSSSDPARQVLPNKAPWQQPWLDVDGGGTPEYRDDQNDRIKIDLIEGPPGMFSPAVDPADVLYHDEEQQFPYTYPEHLLELRDFLTYWRTGFERSLVRFHPEYCYYLNCRGYGDRQDEADIYSSSDGFDVLLTETYTATQARSQDVGLVQYPLTPTTPLWYNVPSLHLLEQDPFADEDLYGDYAVRLQERFAHYMDVEGFSYSMPQLAAVYARCGGNFNSIDPPMQWCRSFGSEYTINSTIVDVPQSVLNAEWETLRAFYRAEKYKLQKQRGDAYVDDCGCAGLNYCINETETSTWWDRMHSPPSFVPFDNGASFADYMLQWITQWASQPGNQPCQPCFTSTYPYYSGKVRRVPEPSGAPIAAGTSLSSAGYPGFLVTGQCPMATAWQMLFQELLGTGHLTDHQSYSLANSPAWQGIMLVLNDYTSAPTNGSMVSFSTSGQTLILDIDLGTGGSCQATLEPPSNIADDVPFSWSDVYYVARLEHTVGNAFNLVVYMADLPEPVTIPGTLCEAFPLAPCNFERVCEPNDLALAWQELLTDIAMSGELTEAMPLTGLILPGSGGLSVQSQVGLAIRSRFSGNPTFQWSFSAVDATLTLRGGTSPSAPYYTLSGLSTEPADLPLSSYLAAAGYFTGINSANENFFTVEVYDPEGDLLCTLRGQQWFTDPNGTEPLPMGVCALPSPANCDSPEINMFEELFAVLAERLGTYPWNDSPTGPGNQAMMNWLEGIDLSESPYMTAQLLAAICPDCELVGVPDHIPMTIEDLGLASTGDTWPNHLRMVFASCLIIDIYSTSQLWGGGLFANIGRPQFVGTTDEFGHYHQFRVQLRPDDAERQELLVTTCFPIQPCAPCPEDLDLGPLPQAFTIDPGSPTPEPVDTCLQGGTTLPVAMRWGNGTVEDLEVYGVVKKDESWDAYARYRDVVDSLNLRLNYGLTHPLRVQHVPFETFVEKGYVKTLDHYLKYLRNYLPAIDVQAYLVTIDSFVVDHSNTVNVESEYARYLKAVANYNQRAQSLGKPLIVDVESDSSFSVRLLTEKNHLYVAYLAGKTPKNTLPLNITNYLDWEENDDPCAVHYREEYLPAHAAYMAAIADSAHPCFGNQQFTPLVGYEEFLLSNLCCSDTGLVVLNEYIATLISDTLPCPGELPQLVSCTLDTGVVQLKMIEVDRECQRLYTLWNIALEQYSDSSYFADSNIPLTNKFNSFAEFEQAGLCSCVQEYLIYLQTYLDWNPGEPKPEKVRSLKEYCEPEKYCSGWFDQLREAMLNEYPGSHYFDEAGTPLMLQWTDANSFLSSGYCNCALSYINYLAAYIQWNGEGPQPPPIMQFVAFCDGAEASCCDNLTALLALQDDLKNSDYMLEYECRFEEFEEDCEKFISEGNCHCLAEYLVYLQGYVAWEDDDPKLPCPMTLKQFCGSAEDAPCANVFNEYYGALVPAIAALANYNEVHHTEHAFYMVEDAALFNSAGLCFCVDAYVAMLKLFTLDPEAYIAEHGFTDALASIVVHCEEPLACCPTTPPVQLLEPPAPVEADPCDSALQANLWINREAAQQAYTTTYINNITARYNSECLNALETFSMDYPDTEHHFTLYYYDRAGNLVRTVPPEGVERKPFTTFEAPEALRIAQDRNNGTHTVYTEHRLASDHVYNNLEQPIRSAMPDQDNMDIRETGPTAGLPPDMRITGSWFGEGGVGMLTGVIDIGSVSRGLVYSTTDGGTTWIRSHGVVAADLHGAHFADDEIGMAVGEHGAVIRTLDGGQSWDLVYNDLMAEGTMLHDVAYASALNIGVVGAGTIATSTNGGDSFTLLNATNATYSGIGYDGTDYTISGTADLVGTEQGFLTTLSTSGSITGTIEQGSIAVDLNCAASYSALHMYVGGDRGVLLHTADGGSNWQTLTTGMTMDFRALYFVDGSFGIALVDSTISGGDHRTVLHKTINGGRTWTPAGNALTDFNDLQPILNGNYTYKECMAVGANGLVWRLLLSGGNVGIQPFGGLQPQVAASTPQLTAVWAARDGNALRCVVGMSNGYHQYNPDLTGTGVWVGEAQISPGTPITRITGAVRPGNQIHCTAIRGNGTMRDVQCDFSTAPPTLTPNTTPPTGTFAGLAQVSSDKAAVRHTTSGALHLIDLSAPTYTTSIPSAWSGLPTMTGHRVTAAIDGPEQVMLTGDGGLLRAVGATWSGSQDQHTHVRPVGLRAMDKAGQVAAGEQGTLFLRSGGTGTAVPTYHAGDFNAVHRLAADDILVVGDAGTCLRVDPTGATPVVTPLVLPVNSDLTDVRAVGNTLYIATANGQLLYSADHTISTPVFSVLPNAGGAMRALAQRPTTTEVVAVGDGATVQIASNGIGSVCDAVYPTSLTAVDLDTDHSGYVVGFHGLARYTPDGGQHWQVVPLLPGATIPLADLHAVDATGPSAAWAVGTGGTVLTLGSTTRTAVSGIGSSTQDFYTVAHANSGARVIAGRANGTQGVYHQCDATPGALFQETIINKPQYASWSFDPYFNSTTEEIEEEIIIGGDDESATRIRFVEGAFVSPAVPAPFPPQLDATPANIDIRSFWFHDRVAGFAGGLGGRLYRTGEVSISHDAFNWYSEPVDLTDNIDGQAFANCDINTIGFGDRFDGFVGGLCSSTPKRYARTLRDEMGLWSQRFWYDRVGRLVLSQNTKQKQGEPERFSYSLYDRLGRVYEAGEVDNTADPLDPQAFRNAVPGAFVGGALDPSVIDANQLLAWVQTQPRREVTRTWYDEPLPGLSSVLTYPQQHLRLRVASTTHQEVYDADPMAYDHATHYSYDIHGNVASLVQDNPRMDIDAGGVGLGHRFKKMFYTYDLISGNVEQVWYQHRKPDAMYHRYSYDADNRLVKAETSTDRWTWYTDAEYFYYPHGPLERVELGENNVQGLDYAYTLQGWLKGINSDRLVPATDMGRDGLAGTVNEEVARDAFGESIGYYGEADYAAIDGTRWNNSNDDRAFAPQNWGSGDGWHPLYNGNIAHTVHSLSPFPDAPSTLAWTDQPAEHSQVLAQVYRYDQLNRLRQSYGKDGLDTDNDWSQANTSPTDMYRSAYAYDANGNIRTAERWDETGAIKYDDFTYKYEGTDPLEGVEKTMRNRLYELYDGGTDMTDDIHADNDASPADPLLYGTSLNNTTNYRYDPLGNLVHDEREDIDNITWTVAGKVKSVERTSASTLPPLEFHYGAGGQRTMKQVADPDDPLDENGYREYYIRDAQGNVMATYRYTNSTSASFRLTERPIYGSSRLGVYARIKQMHGLDLTVVPTTLPSGSTEPMHAGTTHYELTDHLGNVSAVVTGQLLPGGTASAWQPRLLSAQGYEPFGSLLPGRNYSSDSYRFGFGGMPKDDEIHDATGTSYDFGARIYDPRVGRWLSLDPLAAKFSDTSPYVFCSDNPIFWIDVDGQEPIPVTARQFRDFSSALGLVGNQQVGAFFERLVMASLRATEPQIIHNTSVNFPSPVRSRVPGNPTSVRPDGVTARVGMSSKGQIFVSPAFYEAKATSATITKNYRQSQITGMIDAASNMLNKPGELASLTLITTSDTKISQDIKSYAALRGVMLYQSVAAIDDETGEFVVSDREWVNRDQPQFGIGGAGDRIGNLFDWDSYEDYGKVQPVEHVTSSPIESTGGDPDPATIDP